MAPPNAVILDRGMACLASKPKTRVYKGTRISPPPTPAPAASATPRAIKQKPTISLLFNGQRCL